MKTYFNLKKFPVKVLFVYLSFCLPFSVFAIDSNYNIPVKVTSPKKNDKWIVGETKKIKWDGPKNASYIIELLDEKGFGNGVIYQGASGNYYNWKVGDLSMPSDKGDYYREASSGTYMISVVDLENGYKYIDEDSGLFKIINKKSNKNISEETENSNGYPYPTEFSYPQLGTIVTTTNGKFKDSKLNFAIAYYDIGGTYGFFLKSKESDTKINLGKIKIDDSSDQYKGSLKVSKKLKSGWYFLEANNLKTKKTTTGPLFYVSNTDLSKNEKTGIFRIVLDGQANDIYSMMTENGETTKSDAIKSCKEMFKSYKEDGIKVDLKCYWSDQILNVK